ncbi:MAG: glycosyltransferase family 4 protein [Novosphingobium sp.]|nr:glycosyltransferase family 4 protein [Novosphingobium sp.]
MKILYWTDLFLPDVGGIETFSMDLIPALQARGHEVTVVTSALTQDHTTVEELNGIPVHRFPTWHALRTNDLKLLMSARKAITDLKRKFDPDVTHVHFGATAYTFMQTQRAAKAPIVTTVHALPDTSLLQSSLFSKLVAESAHVNAVSVQGYNRLSQAFPQAAECMSYVYYGLGPAAHREVEVVPPSFEQPVILCLGRLIPQKGFDVALKAFAKVESVVPDARLAIVGEGSEEATLKRLAAKLGIAMKVDFPGPVPPENVYQVINTATMLLMPSRYEGLPLVSLQAAKMQRPIISSDVDGLPELIIDGQSGLVLRENNEEELAEAIISLFQNPARAVAMGKAAALRLEERFGFENCVDQYERLYHEAVSAAD